MKNTVLYHFMDYKDYTDSWVTRKGRKLAGGDKKLLKHPIPLAELQKINVSQ